jgi:hypothetical protein
MSDIVGPSRLPLSTIPIAFDRVLACVLFELQVPAANALSLRGAQLVERLCRRTLPRTRRHPCAHHADARALLRLANHPDLNSDSGVTDRAIGDGDSIAHGHGVERRDAVVSQDQRTTTGESFADETGRRDRGKRDLSACSFECHRRCRHALRNTRERPKSLAVGLVGGLGAGGDEADGHRDRQSREYQACDTFSSKDHPSIPRLAAYAARNVGSHPRAVPGSLGWRPSRPCDHFKATRHSFRGHPRRSRRARRFVVPPSSSPYSSENPTEPRSFHARGGVPRCAGTQRALPRSRWLRRNRHARIVTSSRWPTWHRAVRSQAGSTVAYLPATQSARMKGEQPRPIPESASGFRGGAERIALVSMVAS